MKLLIIRPQPGADATAARVRTAGHEAILMPLFEVEPVAWDVPSPDPYDALLLTSANAVRQAGAGLEDLRGLPVLAVGSATGRAANEAGLNINATGEAGVADLIGIAREAGQKHLLWLAGEDHIAISGPDGMALETRIVYRSRAVPPPSNFTDTVKIADAVLLHSPRAALHFGALCDAQAIVRSVLTLAALSPTIAESAGLGWKAIITSPVPNDASLLSQLQSCFTNNNCDP